VEIAFVRELSDRASARREEARIKSLSRSEKLALIDNYWSDASPSGRIDGALAP
jgi:predicted GIY-YIG superfamily endonuclease